MRRYDDPVEVLRGPVPGEDAATGEAPQQFLWHGRLWKVRSVVAHWVETVPWWHSTPARAVAGDEGRGGHAGATETAVQRTWEEVQGGLLAEKELWRVVAGRPSGVRHEASSGVFDLAHDKADGCWQLVGCQD